MLYKESFKGEISPSASTSGSLKHERIFQPGILKYLGTTKNAIMRIALSSLSLVGCNDETSTNTINTADAYTSSFDANISETKNGANGQDAQDSEDAQDIQQDNQNSPDVTTIPDSIDEEVNSQDTQNAQDATDIPDLQIFADIQNDVSSTTDTCIETEDKITNGANAINVLGQVDLVTGAPVYTSGAVNNGEAKTNERGLNQPTGVAIDTTNHRLFITDRVNNRVVVHNLNNSNKIVDYEADYVLGQSNLTTSISATTKNSMSNPFGGIEYDGKKNRLFVADSFNNRVLTYDTTTITNGEDAINVLGQNNFETSEWTTTKNRMKGPYGIAHDNINNRLFVVDTSSNRVLTFNLDTITNGQDATNVLGQSSFDTSAPATGSGMNHPEGASYDSKHNRLFVADNYNNRVLIFDLDNLENGQDATNVLGQTDLNKSEPAITQNGMKGPKGIAYDSIHDRLFVGDSSNNRILIYDTSSITNGQNALNVLGQDDFDASKLAKTQKGLYLPWGLSYNTTNDDLYVADFQNMRIMAFNTKIDSCKTGK